MILVPQLVVAAILLVVGVAAIHDEYFIYGAILIYLSGTILYETVIKETEDE